MKSEYNNGILTFYIDGRVDSSNVIRFEEQINRELMLYAGADIKFNARDMEYISSAGLRVLLKLRKKYNKPIRIYNVSDEVYDIFSITGFTEFLDVEKKMRRISLKGCRKINSALNGEVLSLSDDEMIKVYDNEVPLSEIKQERDQAQAAMISGIPTLIPYDVVVCEHGYGIIFEMSGSESLAHAISRDIKHIKQYAISFANLMREIHRTEIDKGRLPDIKERYRKWLDELVDMDSEDVKVFSALIDAISDSPYYVHGNISINSVMIKDGELLLFDMSGSARGHSIFDLQSIFATLVAIEKTSPGYCRRNFELSKESCNEFWNEFFMEYTGGNKAEVERINSLLLKYFVLKERVLNKIEKKHHLTGLSNTH